MKIINPATEAVITEIDEDSAETIQQKFKTLTDGQRIWAAVSIEKRIASVQNFYELLSEHKEELAHTLTSEMGKPLQQSYNELNGARTRIKFFIDHSQKY